MWLNTLCVCVCIFGECGACMPLSFDALEQLIPMLAHTMLCDVRYSTWPIVLTPTYNKVKIQPIMWKMMDVPLTPHRFYFERTPDLYSCYCKCRQRIMIWGFSGFGLISVGVHFSFAPQFSVLKGHRNWKLLLDMQHDEADSRTTPWGSPVCGYSDFCLLVSQLTS